MMANQLFKLCSGGLFAVVLAFAGTPADATEPMHFVMEKFPPYILDEAGRGTGPFPEVVGAVCEAMKKQCSMRVLPWRRALALAEMGRADGIFVLARTPEREKVFHFSDPVFQSSFAVIARDPDFAYTQAQDLAGFTVVTYGPSAVSKEIEALAKFVPGMRLIVEIDNQSVLRKLRAGRYPEPAAVVMNREVGLELIRQEKLDELRIVGDFKPVTYAIGFPRKHISAQRADEFNRTLRALSKQGTIKAIADKYGLKPAL